MRILIAAALVLASHAAHAACSCRCVNGSPQALCSNALEIRPICAPQVCAIAPPSVAPIQRPTLPPVGTSTCTQKQVLNPFSNRYEWKTVCR